MFLAWNDYDNCNDIKDHRLRRRKWIRFAKPPGSQSHPQNLGSRQEGRRCSSQNSFPVRHNLIWNYLQLNWLRFVITIVSWKLILNIRRSSVSSPMCPHKNWWATATSWLRPTLSWPVWTSSSSRWAVWNLCLRRSSSSVPLMSRVASTPSCSM